MRILVLNADYPRFLAWFYRRQAELESASYATQPGCLASPISIRKLRRAGPPCSGDSRQQSMAPGRLGTRTRHGVRSPRAPGAIGRKAPPATSVSARIAQFAGCANLVLQWARGSA